MIEISAQKHKIFLFRFVTYIIQLVYDKLSDGNLKILALVLVSVPNGRLKNVYKNDICGGSKNKNEAFRYYYKRKPKFDLIKNKPYRIQILYLHPDIENRPEEILGFDKIGK